MVIRQPIEPIVDKIRPVTPLPWVETERLQEVHVNGHFLLFRSVENVDYETGGGVALVHEKQGRESNAAYIVHACNNYPRLVEALKECAANVSFLEVGEKANALLRELGESA